MTKKRSKCCSGDCENLKKLPAFGSGFNSAECENALKSSSTKKLVKGQR
jgi:hypothetical protein